MQRHAIAVLLSALMMVGTSSAAWSASQTNTAPLPPAGAAGIKQAQGEGGGVLVGAAVTVGIFLAMVLLIDDGDEGVSTSTGTAP